MSFDNPNEFLHEMSSNLLRTVENIVSFVQYDINVYKYTHGIAY